VLSPILQVNWEGGTADVIPLKDFVTTVGVIPIQAESILFDSGFPRLASEVGFLSSMPQIAKFEGSAKSFIFSKTFNHLKSESFSTFEKSPKE
jgi:hypothetical protein